LLLLMVLLVRVLMVLLVMVLVLMVMSLRSRQRRGAISSELPRKLLLLPMSHVLPTGVAVGLLEGPHERLHHGRDRFRGGAGSGSGSGNGGIADAGNGGVAESSPRRRCVTTAGRCAYPLKVLLQMMLSIGALAAAAAGGRRSCQEQQ